MRTKKTMRATPKKTMRSMKTRSNMIGEGTIKVMW